MFPRSAHSLLRLAPLLVLSLEPACAVYDSSMLQPGEDTSSSAAATSSGGAQGVGSAGGTGGSAGTGNGAGATAGGSVPFAGGSNGGNTNAGSGGSGGANTAGGAGNGSAGAAGKGGAGGMVATAGSGGSGSAPSGGAGGASGGSTSGSGGGGATGVDPCSRANWKASASESSLTMTPPQLYNPPAQAIDGDGDSRWSSGAAQVGGEWFRIDLGAVATHLTQLVLDTSVHPTDYPVNYKLELSSDGSAYTSVATGSGSSLTTIKFADRAARYLKVTQTGASSAWWSIHEISISCQSN